MILRAAKAEDFDALAAIVKPVILETAIHFAYEPVSGDDLRSHWSHDRETYPYLVAAEDDRILGFAKAGAWRERAAYGWTPECSVYVAKDAQRRGIARSLYTRLFEILTTQGFHSVIAGITLPNEASVRLHESMGFRSVGRVARAGWKMGRWHDVGFWQKDLADPGAAPSPRQPPPR